MDENQQQGAPAAPSAGKRFVRRVKASIHTLLYNVRQKSWWKKQLPSIAASIAKGIAQANSRKRDE